MNKRVPHIKESLVVNACIRWLWLNGCFVWRNNSGGFKPEGAQRIIRYGRVGSPDIIGMTPTGRFIGVECKSGRNKLSDQQEAFKVDTFNHHGLYITAYSVDDLEANKWEVLK